MHGFHREIGRRYHVGEGIETARRLFLRQSGRRRQRVPVQCCMVFVVGFAEDEDGFRRAERAGKLMNFHSSKDAMDHGFALITEERKADGLFLKADITFNTTIANMSQYKSGIALSKDEMVRATAEEIRIMHTKCMGPDDMIANLSGGNQQKAIFGRWLERSPKIFMMDDPTRGIDVGAKYEIYELIIDMAKQGKTIIVVSSEMPEILGITNRIGVMSNGHLAGIVNTKETNQEELLRLSAKYL